MIRNVVFDFGNVLASVDRLAACSRMAAHSPFTAEEVVSFVYGNDIEVNSETGVFDSRAHYEAVRERIRATSDWTYEQFVDEFETGFVLIDEGVRELRRMRELGKRVFVLSNTSYLHSVWIFRQEVLATVPEWHVFSYKVGVMKPDPRIWRYLLEKSGTRAHESLFIDDVPAYCDAARSLGFAVINYRKGETDLRAEIDRLL